MQDSGAILYPPLLRFSLRALLTPCLQFCSTMLPIPLDLLGSTLEQLDLYCFVWNRVYQLFPHISRLLNTLDCPSGQEKGEVNCDDQVVQKS